jgi:hypothetical protein
MSWDVMIFTKDPRTFTGDTGPPPLGDAGDVRLRIAKVFPKVDWRDPAWGVLEGRGWSIEFNHQTNGMTTSIMLHVRGGGDPLTAITSLCRSNGWVALDCSSGELIDLVAPSSKSWREFQEYRNQIGGSTQAAQKPNFVREHPELMLSVGLLAVAVIVHMARKKR